MWTGTDWFRFTVVREPLGRVWSAWVNKLLLRHPAFVEIADRLGLTTALPRTSDRLRGEFLSFVARVRSDPVGFYNAHWAPQTDRVGSLPYTHIGRIESLSDTLDQLSQHLGQPLPPIRRSNSTPLRFSPAVLDDDSRRALNELFAEDQRRFGYPPVEAPADAPAELTAWEAEVAVLLPVVELLVLRHERIGQLVEAYRSTNGSGSADMAPVRVVSPGKQRRRRQGRPRQ